MNALTADDVQAKVEIFWKLIDVLLEPRRGLVRSMMDGKVGDSYFLSPASSRTDFHSCYPGGLLVHSLNVVQNLRRLTKSLCPDKYSDATLVFVGLFHDLGKCGDGVNEYYLPNESEWHKSKGMLYDVNKVCEFMPTSERGLYILQKNGIQLNYDEYMAIRLNDGMYDDTNKNYRMKEPELALLVHWADMWSTKLEKSN